MEDVERGLPAPTSPVPAYADQPDQPDQPEEGPPMKYLILIHSHPEPWGHPTTEFTAEGRAQPSDERAAGDQAFDVLLTELSGSGELVTAEALASPADASFYGWKPGGTFVTDGPFAESKEQFAGFFLIDVATRERAEEVAEQFAGPGSVVELRPAWTG